MTRLLRRNVFGALFALALLGLSTSAALADPRDFTLINNTGTDIHQVYVSPSNLTDWGDDILGEDILPGGATVAIHFQRFSDGACLYDIKVVTDTGNEGTLGQVNLCTTDTVTFS